MSPRTRLVCASANPDKVAEMAAILADRVDLLPRPADVADVIEDAESLEGNARLKAAAICAATGLPAVADDTGLEVIALGGAPGVRSARYAGDSATYEDNRRKLLDALDAVVDLDDRRAAFRTCVVVVWPDGRELMVEGVCSGAIAHFERGVGGFGYDSVFIPDDGDGRTFGEMSEDEKHRVSHRGRALRNLVAAL